MIMEIMYKGEHTNCSNYDHSEKPLIEVVKIAKGERNKSAVINNEIVFIIVGRVRYCFQNLPTHEAVKGQIIFRPASEHYSYDALADSTVVIFRLPNHIQLCRNFSIEKLYGIKAIVPGAMPEREKNRIGTLEINSRIWYFLDGLIDCIADGLKCRCWFELKITEFFTYLRAYYTKEEVHDFFLMILSGNTAFSEYVRLNWHRFASVNEMANALNMNRNKFSKQFAKVFDTSPYRWMSEGRAKKVHDEITYTSKSFKQISLDNKFRSEAQFTRFVKEKYHKTPTELRKNAKFDANGKIKGANGENHEAK